MLTQSMNHLDDPTHISETNILSSAGFPNQEANQTSLVVEGGARRMNIDSSVHTAAEMDREEATPAASLGDDIQHAHSVTRGGVPT